MILAVLVLAVAFEITAFPVSSFPAHRSLAGLSPEQLDMILPKFSVAPPENPPGPLNDTSAKLVNDAAHPWRSPAPNDMRGPCPGLNTLASHGVSYLPSLLLPLFGHGPISISPEMELLLQPRLSLLQWRVSLEFNPSNESELM